MADATEKFDPKDHPHRRFNPLTGQWVLVCPHRMKRPWKGQVEKPPASNIPRFDATNPLCPGVTRPNGVTNLDYKETFVFDNDFPALLNHVPVSGLADEDDDELFQMTPAAGDCKVMCFHPYSDLTLALMSHPEIQTVIKRWISLFSELSQKWTWVQIFENRGSIMGCSNPHPHCQVWSSDFLPNEAELKDTNLKSYFIKHGSNLLIDYTKKEIDKQVRVVCQNADWVVLVPFWAVWPYETMLLPIRHVQQIDQLNETEVISLSEIMKELLIRYDNLFQTSFPYSMGWHGAPNTGEDNSHWQLHALYYPPLLRSATVRKFMVGYEMFANAQRDLTAEQAAEKLRNLSKIHYTESGDIS